MRGGIKPVILDIVPEEARVVIENCWKKQEERPTIDEVIHEMEQWKTETWWCVCSGNNRIQE